MFTLCITLRSENFIQLETCQLEMAFTDCSFRVFMQQVVNKSTGKSLQVGPNSGSIYDSASSEGYYSCGLGNLCQCALCITPKPPQYSAVPTNDPKTAQPSNRTSQVQRRRTTFSASAIRRYTEAKGQQITGREQLLLPIWISNNNVEIYV